MSHIATSLNKYIFGLKLEMHIKKMLAIIGALIGGGLEISLVSLTPQAAQAGIAVN